MASGLTIFFALLIAYLLLVVLLVRTGLMRRWNMSLFLGVALMVKTTRGQKLLDWFARARTFWDRFAHFGLYLTGAAMLGMTALLILQLPIVLQLPPERVPSPSLILGIPGINPIIPVGFGIIALVFAVVVHEFSHGIMSRVYDLKVKTMGLLFFIVPIGAFVEPDEEQLKAASRMKRIKVFSAGPLSNLVFALLFALIFSGALLANAAPTPGAAVRGIEAGGPAHGAGLQPGWIITHVAGQPIDCATGFADAMRGLQPENTTASYPAGVLGIIIDPPVLYLDALNASASYSIRLSEAPAQDTVVAAQPPAGALELNSTQGAPSGHDRTFTFTPVDWQQPRTVTVTAPTDQGWPRTLHVAHTLDGQVQDQARLSVYAGEADPRSEGSLHTVYPKLDVRIASPAQTIHVRPARAIEVYNSPEFLAYYQEVPAAANRTVIGISFLPTCELYDAMANPLDSGRNFLTYISLPFFALSGQFPLSEPFTSFFDTPFDPTLFWTLASLAYWLFWIDLMLGLTNALPLVPLDGGHMFRDFAEGALIKLRPNMQPEARARAARRITGVAAILILLLVLAQFFGPGLVASLR